KAADLDALAHLRSGLRERVACSAVGDAKQYATAVEAGYRTMWRDWCAKASTRTIAADKRSPALEETASSDQRGKARALPAITPGKIHIDFLKQLIGTDAPVILDLGANDGATTAMFLDTFPNCTIYAFEPDPRAIAKFRERINDPRARLFEIALG